MTPGPVVSRFAAFLSCVFLVTSAYALDPNRAMSQYLRDRWGNEQGFGRGPVYAISQTADGYLWIGTESGLFRFDGFRFQSVRDDKGTFKIRNVLDLAADRDGCLWMRLQDLTILRYCNGVFENPASGASTISRTSRGEILFARLNQGALTFRDGGLRIVASASHLSRSPVTALAQTANGDVWMGTRDAGVFRVEEGKASPILNELPDAKIDCLLADGDRALWIGTDDGIARWDGSTLTTAEVPASLGHFQALSMARDRDANLWVGTDSQGLLRFNSRGVIQLSESNGFSQEAVTAVFEDREGNIWIGSTAGLERLRDSTFITYSLPEGLPTDGNNPVFVDSEDRMWFPPVSGGLWWEKGADHGRIAIAGLDKDVVYSIAGRNGELWLGRQRGGLTRLFSESGSFVATTYTRRDGLAQNSVYSVYEARDGSVWAGTVSGGASHLTGGKFTTYTVADGLASNSVSAILESRDGTTWFATASGLSALSKGHWQTYTPKDGLPSGNVNCLLEDSHGILWIGTDAGPAFRDSEIHVPAGDSSILQESVLGMAEDSFGWIWMTTSSHVLRVNRDKLMHGALGEGDIREFGLGDGLRGVEGVRRNRSVITDQSGRIWFSLNRGISSVDPARLTRSSVPAIVHLHSISVDNNPSRWSGLIHVPGGSKRITFGFIGLSLSSPERVRFRYQLDGFDRGWSEPSASREAMYTNLSPGPYRFRVVASNPDGVWSTDEAAISLQVDPLFWQTWWFRFVVSLACALVAAAAYRMRLRRLTRRLNMRFDERLAERTRIAQELHDTLLQGFLSASMQVHVAAGRLPADSQAKPILNRALQLMGQVIDEGRNAVRGLRSSKSASLDLEQALSLIQEEMYPGERASEQVDFRVVVNGDRRPLNPALRDDVYRIGREALINALRHSQAKSIEVGLTYSSSRFLLSVRDDGRGIDPVVIDAGLDGHWGLSGMRERAERIGVQLRVFTAPAAGTEIRLSVPGAVAFQDYRGHTWRWLSRRRSLRNTSGRTDEKNGKSK